MEPLGRIAKDVISCTKCGLCETRTNAVPGKGGAGSGVMLIGEAPGASEDARGEPFVGAAGMRLEGSLERAGRGRSSAYITNVVKCRPPNNRVPTQQERDACSGHLEREIAAAKPAIIGILGNTAFGSLLGGTNITKHRGKVYRKGGNLYYITIHPAATIYNRELTGTLDADIAEMFAMAAKIAGGGHVTPDVECGP